MRSLGFWQFVVSLAATLWVIEHWIAPNIISEGMGSLNIWVAGTFIWLLIFDAVGGLSPTPKKEAVPSNQHPPLKVESVKGTPVDKTSAALAKIGRAHV